MWTPERFCYSRSTTACRGGLTETGFVFPRLQSCTGAWRRRTQAWAVSTRVCCSLSKLPTTVSFCGKSPMLAGSYKTLWPEEQSVCIHQVKHRMCMCVSQSQSFRNPWMLQNGAPSYSWTGAPLNSLLNEDAIAVEALCSLPLAQGSCDVLVHRAVCWALQFRPLTQLLVVKSARSISSNPRIGPQQYQAAFCGTYLPCEK